MRIPQRSIAFALIATLTLLCLPLNAQEGRLTCASNDGRYRYCRADTQNRVQLVRQISNSRCSQGYSWGFDYRGIWVNRGCRAEFVYGRRGGGGGSNTGAAVAAGILGAIIVGAAVASSKHDNNMTIAPNTAAMPIRTAIARASAIGTAIIPPITCATADASPATLKAISPRATTMATTTGRINTDERRAERE